MFYLLTGLIIGVVMGLTGAGGALVSLPLFMWFFKMDLKEASFLALISVILSSSINFIFQRKFSQIKLALTVFIFSTFGTMFALPYKSFFSSFSIALIISIISFYSLFVVWIKGFQKNKIDEDLKKISFLFVLIIGFLLGILTTLTGLGGGVLLMPLFLNVFKLNEKKALATSLLATFLSSSFSFIMQGNKSQYVLEWQNVIFMGVGILTSVLILRKITELMTVSQNLMVKKIVFTLVVLMALSKIFH